MPCPYDRISFSPPLAVPLFSVPSVLSVVYLLFRPSLRMPLQAVMMTSLFLEIESSKGFGMGHEACQKRRLRPR